MIRYVAWLVIFMAAYAGSEYVFGSPAIGVGAVFGVLLARSEQRRERIATLQSLAAELERDRQHD